MSQISNLQVLTVAKGTNLVGVINSLIYEVSFSIAPGGTGVEKLTFDIPNSRLRSDATGVPASSTGNPPMVIGLGPNTFPSLLSKLNVSTTDDDAARAALFHDPKLKIGTRYTPPVQSFALDILPGDTAPGVRGTVTVDVEVVEYTLAIVAIVIDLASAFL